MKPMIERLPELREIILDKISIVQNNVGHAIHDRHGESTNLLGTGYRDKGIVEYKLDHNPQVFRQYLKKSAESRKSLFDKREQGHSIDDSYLSMLAYKSLFDALAAGDWELSTAIAAQMGGREKIEKQYDHPFDYAFGYTLKHFVLNDREQTEIWVPRFRDVCMQTNSEDFLGYADVFEAILRNDLVMAQRGFENIVAGHQRQSKKGGVFALNAYQLLCVWGIGLANLCRHRSLRVTGIPPLIPDDLLI